MPQITNKWLVLLFACSVAVACSKGTDIGKVFVPSAGHPVAWASHLAVGTTDFHGTFIKTVPETTPGARIFVLHCAPCQGNDGSGRIGPDIRQLGQSLSIVNAAIQNIPLMHGHKVLSDAEVQSAVDYIATLGSTSTPLTGAFDPSLCTQCHGEDLSGGIASVSCHACHNGPDGSIGHPDGWRDNKNTPLSYHGSYGRTFVSGCTTCHGANLLGSIVLKSSFGVAPSCSSCHNGSVAPAL